ncbi:MAG: Sec-independent protein translocase protein TatA [Pseudohongiellaceae bacterium]|jgi:Sec-independent protein translocase protein TatA
MASELAALLLLVTIFLLFHIKKLKKLIAKLEEKITKLRQSMGVSKKSAAEAQKKLTKALSIKPKAYMDYLDQQIEDTRDHHNTLNPDRDIVLDISTDSPLERQAAALRHAFLIAEKEADYSGEDDASDWAVLQSKFEQIIQFYEQAAEPDETDIEPVDITQEGDSSEEEIATLKKRIENLEKFKKLFFDMESKWSKAKKEADGYQEQLAAMGTELGAGDEFEGLLKKYAGSYGEVGDMIAQGTGDIDARTMGGSTTIIGNRDEIDRLRNMAADQHKVITGLKRQLVDASSAEQQADVMSKLGDQLDRQDRFLKEAETCAQLLEDELNRSLDENQELRALVEAGSSSEDLEKLEGLVTDLTHGSRDMLKTIAALEVENSDLQLQLVSGDGTSGAAPMTQADAGAVAEEVEVINKKLLTAQQELLNLQTQHIELEERYLELKMESM